VHHLDAKAGAIFLPFRKKRQARNVEAAKKNKIKGVHEPWLMMGDFSEAMWLHKHFLLL
jgi:hypothetical protein